MLRISSNLLSPVQVNIRGCFEAGQCFVRDKRYERKVPKSRWEGKKDAFRGIRGWAGASSCAKEEEYVPGRIRARLEGQSIPGLAKPATECTVTFLVVLAVESAANAPGTCIVVFVIFGSAFSFSGRRIASDFECAHEGTNR